MSYISVEHLSFSYEQETVLEDISFTVEPGQFCDFDRGKRSSEVYFSKKYIRTLNTKEWESHDCKEK